MLTKFSLRVPMLTFQPNEYLSYPNLFDEIIYNPYDVTISLIPQTPSSIIRWFHLLPDIAFQELLKSFSMIKNDFHDDEIITNFMNIARDTYYGIQLWLMRKHDSIITESLFDTYNDLQYVAESSLAGFNLIQNIFDEKYRNHI